MRISDWSSDVCSSDLPRRAGEFAGEEQEASPFGRDGGDRRRGALEPRLPRYGVDERAREKPGAAAARRAVGPVDGHEQLSGTLTGVEGDAVEAVALRRLDAREPARSEEHTSELQSLMRISYAVFCLKKK